MNTATRSTFYLSSGVRKGAALVAPVLVLGGIWLLVTQVLMVPGVPGPGAAPDEVAQFIMHEKGLPRLSRARTEEFLEAQVRQMVQREGFLDRFMAEYRTASPEQQSAFRSHLFDAFKPVVMADIREHEVLTEAGERQAFLDERIVAYNRLARFWGNTTISKGMLGPGALSPQETLDFLLNKTTEEERQSGIAYAQALRARVEEILADPELKAEFEARIAGEVIDKGAS